VVEREVVGLIVANGLIGVDEAGRIPTPEVIVVGLVAVGVVGVVGRIAKGLIGVAEAGRIPTPEAVVVGFVALAIVVVPSDTPAVATIDFSTPLGAEPLGAEPLGAEPPPPPPPLGGAPPSS
jgi:hypothetical protein